MNFLLGSVHAQRHFYHCLSTLTLQYCLHPWSINNLLKIVFLRVVEIRDYNLCNNYIIA